MANQNHGEQRRELASQALAPFHTKPLWRRQDAGHKRYKLCATRADEPATKLIFTKALAAPQPFDEDSFNCLIPDDEDLFDMLSAGCA